MARSTARPRCFCISDSRRTDRRTRPNLAARDCLRFLQFPLAYSATTHTAPLTPALATQEDPTASPNSRLWITGRAHGRIGLAVRTSFLYATGLTSQSARRLASTCSREALHDPSTLRAAIAPSSSRRPNPDHERIAQHRGRSRCRSHLSLIHI